MADNSSLTSGLEILCPVDGRRSTGELIKTLFAINFTVMFAFGHLMSLRNEKYGGRGIMNFVMFFACPLIMVADLFAPIVVVLVQWCYYSRDQNEIKRMLATITGRIPGRTDLITEPRRPSPKLSSLSLLFRCLLQLGLIVQCIGSIYLYARRYERNAETVYDSRLLQLAIAGLSIGLLTLFQLVVQPEYPPGPVEPWLASLRPVKHDMTSHRAWYSSYDAASSRAWYSPIDVMSRDMLAGLPAYAFLAVFSICSDLSLSTNNATNVFVRLWPLSFLFLLNMRPQVSPLLRLLSFVVPFATDYFFLILSFQMTTAGRVHLDLYKSCPGAWKDPKSDLVWGLA